ncbi:MAG: hypothetical protein QOH31_489 [Verrucomicrobiota bacterium]|jgi:hypothetical protein
MDSRVGLNRPGRTMKMATAILAALAEQLRINF